MFKKNIPKGIVNSPWYESLSGRVTALLCKPVVFLGVLGLMTGFALVILYTPHAKILVVFLVNACGLVNMFLVLLIQKAQKRDFLALEIKLNELVLVRSATHKGVLDAQNMEAKLLDQLQQKHANLASEAPNPLTDLVSELVGELEAVAGVSALPKQPSSSSSFPIKKTKPTAGKPAENDTDKASGKPEVKQTNPPRSKPTGKETN